MRQIRQGAKEFAPDRVAIYHLWAMTEAQPVTMPSLLTRSVENVSTILGVWHRSYRTRPIHAGIGDALVPALLLLLVQALGYRILQPHAALNISVVQNYAGATALALVAMAVVLAVTHKGEAGWQACIGVLWALLFGNILSTGALMISDPLGLADWMFRRFGLVFLVPFLFLSLRLRWHGMAAFVGLITPTSLVALPWIASLWAPPADDAVVFNPDVEMIYAAQNSLLNEQIVRLRPSEPGKAELFAVLGAGYPFEGVFRREVEAVGTLLADEFGAKDRIISLVNDDADLTSFPLMNRVNLRAALQAVTQAMDPEDIVLLFISTHGGPGMLSTNFHEVITRDVMPKDIQDALAQAGNPNAIVVLPACYSGSFAETLASPNRLVLTGADADSISFGCNDQNEWTDWGRAFFVEGLSQTRDPREAAALAQEIVLAQEKEEGLPPSSPLILEGTLIGRILDTWLEELAEGL